ncbi:MAG: hypothetical protein OEL69_09755 [Nitrosopumilus sp.]|jgi:hypothetical protein|nr:hypothetical protein [Nitrosopumilus sp.]
MTNIPKANPDATAAPIARPSPKLCTPIPIAIIKPIATSFEIFNEDVYLKFSLD